MKSTHDNRNCPSVELLRRSLDPDDPLPDHERKRIEDHVDRCPRDCKQVIAAMLQDQTLPRPQNATAPDVLRLELASPPPDLSRQVPGYEILSELGRGGMGVVYKARQLALNRVVALKMIRRGAHAEAEDLLRFRIEAEAVAGLKHPNIVQIFEVGRFDGGPYFALEFVEGGSLAQRLRSSRPPAAEAARLCEALARAMQHAHGRGILHRDLKPANILIAADATPKITDFGLARRLEGSDLTETGIIMGTPSYMAPEQAAGGTRELTPAVDVYALGAILYELLTGDPPVPRDTPLNAVLRHLDEEPLPPRQLRPRVPRDLETICLKCLARDPARRYESAHDLAEDLRCFLDDQPIQARRAGKLEKLWRRIRRNPALSALIAAVLLLGGIVVGVIVARPGTPTAVTSNEADTSADELRDLVAELDRTDPDWRLEQIEAKRREIPEDQNGALQISAYRKLVMESRGAPVGEGQGTVNAHVRERMEALDHHAPRTRLSEADDTLFRTELKRQERALPAARKMKEYPTGRFHINYARDAYSTNLTDWAAGRHLADVLRLEALVQIQDGNRGGAVTNCLAMLHVGRAYMDEPMAHVEWQGILVIHHALQVLERMVAQTDCTDAELGAFQHVLMETAAIPLPVTMARGERGAMHYFFTSLAAGDLPDSSLLQKMGLRDRSDIPSGQDIRRLHAWLLQCYTEFVAIARNPPEEQPRLLKALNEKAATAPLAGAPLFIASTRISDKAAAATWQLAELRSAAVALAVERYRLAHGEWPRDLTATVSVYLKEVPSDPYDGSLLQYRRTEDGVVVYGLGPDRADNQGKLDRSAIVTVPTYMNEVSWDPYLKELPMAPSAGVDVGFQLWDAAKRR